MKRQISRDLSISATVAGLIALVATYSGPVLIVVQAAQAGKLSQDLLSTWIWALSLGSAILGLWLSLRLKVPVIGAWSTPGVALLISGLAQYPFSDVIGCYVVVTTLIAVIGYSGLFARLMEHLPTHLLSAMIAGVLVFGEHPDLPTLIGSALIVGSGIYTLNRSRQVRRRT